MSYGPPHGKEKDEQMKKDAAAKVTGAVKQEAKKPEVAPHVDEEKTPTRKGKGKAS